MLWITHDRKQAIGFNASKASILMQAKKDLLKIKLT